MSRAPAFLALRALAIVAAITTFAGCTTQIVLPVAPQPDVAPAPTTPAAALSRLAWGWKHRAIDPCRDLFTCDYEFDFAPGDSAGIRFQDRPWTRPDEIDFTYHLFETGSATAPPANYVALDMGSNLQVLPDDRPGKDPGWHHRVETPFVAVVEAPGRQFRILGFEAFYFVRGDSACIPQELRDQGYGPDPNRWWIDRWVEYVVSAAPAASPSVRTPPLRPISLGAIKALYLDSPPAP